MLKFLEIHHQVIAPQRRPLADGRRLGRLQVSESQAGQVTVSRGKHRQVMDHADQAVADQFQGLSQQQQIGVVGDEATGGSKMNDPASLRAPVSVGVHMGHHVVPEIPLVTGSHLEIDVVDRLA